MNNAIFQQCLLDYLFWAILVASLICTGIVASLLTGCGGNCAADLSSIAQAYPAEHGFHRVDLINPDKSYLSQLWNIELR